MNEDLLQQILTQVEATVADPLASFEGISITVKVSPEYHDRIAEGFPTHPDVGAVIAAHTETTAINIARIPVSRDSYFAQVANRDAPKHADFSSDKPFVSALGDFNTTRTKELGQRVSDILNSHNIEFYEFMVSVSMKTGEYRKIVGFFPPTPHNDRLIRVSEGNWHVQLVRILSDD